MKVNENISKRQYTVKYYVEKLKLCHKTVCKIFGDPQENSVPCGENKEWERNKSENRPRKLQQTEIDRIIEHISSFPLQKKHNESSKKCLSPDLNLMKMHTLFGKIS